jgi:hypothetical protein
MPEPNTVTAPREPEPRDESTAGWVQPPVASESPPEAAVTVTRTIASTPGPGDAERHTIASQTQAITPGDLGHPTRLPDIPGYRVEQMIGRGGMGVVYRAIDLTLNRVVALKVMHPGGRDYQHVMGRFDREVQALATIDHPNIVRIYGADDWHGFPYFTMQFVPGGPLSQHLGRFHGDPAACARLVLRVARAVQALHDHGVIHRDLKPLNILLGDSDEPLVADFGLAKWIDDDPQSDYSVTGHPVGTRQYMAPEQTLGKRSDYSAACDVWAIGVVLYELLAGRRPFADDGRGDLLKRIREEAPPAMPETVPSELAAVVAKCLAKSASERYPTAAAVADDLERWLAGEPVSVAAPRRSRAGLMAAGLLGLVGLIALPAVAMLRNDTPTAVPKKGIPERLRDGERVKLIDANGRVLVEPRILPGCNTTITKGPKGHALLNAAGFAAVELSGENLPWPVKLRAEYAVLPDRQNSTSRFGVYAGGKVTPGPIPCQSIVHLTHQREQVGRNGNNRTQLIREFYGFHLAAWTRFPPGSQASFPGSDRTITVPSDPDDTLDWYKVELVISPDILTGTWNGLPVGPVFGSRAPGRQPHQCIEWWSGLVDQPGGPHNFAPPYIGPGLGLCAFNGAAAYRNVTLEAVTP